MSVKENQTYRTPLGSILKVKTVRDAGVHTLVKIDESGDVIPDVKNSFGHVIDRSERFCSNETIANFKKIK